MRHTINKIFVMRVFIAVLLLIFSLQSYTKADDIRDFQIENISLGDSLLDYMSKEEIISNEQKVYDSNSKFYEIQYPLSGDLYRYLLFHVKRNDPNYIIHLIRGVNIVEDEKDCLKIKMKIVKEMKTLFNEDKLREGSQNHYYYKNSTQYISQFDFENSGFIKAECVIMHEKDLKIHGSIYSTLEVSISSGEFSKWLSAL